jgi:hypothetical protein
MSIARMHSVRFSAPSCWSISGTRAFLDNSHPAVLAAQAGCAPCLSAILAYSASVTSEAAWTEVLRESISSVSLETLQTVLDAAPAHLVQSLAQMSLHQLCAHIVPSFIKTQHIECYRLWPLVAHALSKGACVDTVCDSSNERNQLKSSECTPLGLLVVQRCPAGVEILVRAHKAEVNLSFGKNQHTALHLACAVGPWEPERTEAMIEKLVSLGTDLHAVTADDDTVLHVAVKRSSH